MNEDDLEFFEIIDEETGDVYFYCEDDYIGEPDYGTDVDALLAMIREM